MTKLLIVENDSFTGNFLSTTLVTAGFEVTKTNSAPEAMSVFRESTQECALIDIELGQGPNGIDLARAFRKIQPKVGVVFLTSIIDPRLIDLKSLNLPDSSIFLPKSFISEITEIAESIHESIEIAEVGGRECLIRDKSGMLDLTNGQFELIRLIAEGLSNQEIARKKFVTVKSAENSIARLAKKLDIKDLNTNSQRVLIAKRYFQMIGKV